MVRKEQNDSKCQNDRVIIIQKNAFVGPLRPIEIARNTINYKTECKLLGVYIDSKLTWNTQIEKVRRKFTVYNAML